MWYIVIAAILVISFIAGCKQTAMNNKGKFSDDEAVISEKEHPLEKAIENVVYSKKDIEKKLTDLSKMLINTKPAVYATCYDTIAPPHFAQYICPVCGNKTLITLRSDYEKDNGLLSNIENRINLYNEIIKKVDGINIVIEKSNLCKSCNPDLDVPKLSLLVNFPNSTDTTRVSEFGLFDLYLIKDFLNGNNIDTMYGYWDIPINEKIDRLQELLGIDLKNSDK